ncbi:unnamed protein product [Lactuca virosa]|uniref:Uncharacterized protein n=1 Tax=Lactuca virosa TaxID=75947 RepID=A0AAU9NXP6_9ASTR|nr:unnamed protein product [Lactuca virosa]
MKKAEKDGDRRGLPEELWFTDLELCRVVAEFFNSPEKRRFTDMDNDDKIKARVYRWTVVAETIGAEGGAEGEHFARQSRVHIPTQRSGDTTVITQPPNTSKSQSFT